MWRPRTLGPWLWFTLYWAAWALLLAVAARLLWVRGRVGGLRGRLRQRRLMDKMREAYLTPRSRADVPLLRAVDWFLAYRKGPFAMYALREYVGEERVNTALRRMMERYGAGVPPLPTSRDLYRELQAVTPEAQRGLLHDLFEANTFWELATKGVTAEPAGDGT